ncbi:MAG: DUF1573 domain-containing protein [Lentimicrobiaceae bacterium]|nr:DUF1573 domain-containing protein [Lentimicrobiaceae bacterium]
MKKFLTLLTIALSLVFVNHSCKPKEEEPGSIYGIVTDKATGEPVKTAGVELSPLGLKTVTGSEGQFEFAELEAGEYKLFVTKTGYTELLSSTIIVKSAQTAKGDVQIEKLPAALKVVDDKGEEISELDFGNQYDDVSRMFSIFNDGTEVLNYEIVKTAAWITSLSVTEGSLEPGATKPIVVNIDREKLQVGENTTTLHITSNNGSKQLTIHVEKQQVLNIVDNKGKEVNELDFGSDDNELSRTFNILNNGGAKLHYQITKSVDWISNISSTEGDIEGGGTLVIVVTLDRAKLPVGDNSTTLVVSTNNGNKQLAVKAKKLPSELHVTDTEGNDINEIDFGSKDEILSYTFNILNNGGAKLHYQITKSVDWISNISSTEGDIMGGESMAIVITIDRAKLPVGDNSTTLHIVTDNGSKQLAVKAKKKAPELVIQNINGTLITKLDFGTSNTSMTFNIYNKGYETINYQITKTVDWIESINNMEGTIEAGLKKPIVVVINRALLPLGDNSTLLQITSDIGSKQLEIKCNGGKIVTSAATDITGTTAKLKGSTTNSTYTEKGFYFGEDLNVTTKCVVEGNDFSYQLSDLTEGKTYYYKAYLIHNNITYYGDVKEFSTKCLHAGHEYVDLALPSGLRWATCNSGAGSPEEYGNYLNFGEAEDATWGGNWRCPTKSEWEELKSNCAWTWTTKDGVKGYEVVGSNGNSIFLPAAGYRSGSSFHVGSRGYYWSSTPYNNSNSYAYYFYFDSSGQNMDDDYRSQGQSVRLVAE